MPANDPASRGARRKLKDRLDNGNNGEVRQVTLREVCDVDQLVQLIEDLHAEGMGLSISRTKDGGCIALGFLMGGKPVMRYAPTREAWQALLDQLA